MYHASNVIYTGNFASFLDLKSPNCEVWRILLASLWMQNGQDQAPTFQSFIHFHHVGWVKCEASKHCSNGVISFSVVPGLPGKGNIIYIYIIWILKNIWYLSYYIMIYFFFVRDAVSLFTRHSYNLLQKDDECVQYAEWRCSQVVNLVQSCFVTDKVTIVLALTTHVDTRFREPR